MKALLLIDIQKGFDNHAHWGGSRNNASMETNARAVLAFARSEAWPIFHVQHNSTDKDSPLHPTNGGNEFKEGFEPWPAEEVIVKSVNSAFIGTDLEKQLKKLKVKELVICGISTEHCVSTTTRMATNLGFTVELVGDACHAWPHGEFNADLVHRMELAVLNGEFATVVTTTEFIV